MERNSTHSINTEMIINKPQTLGTKYDYYINANGFADETRTVYELKLIDGSSIVKEFGWKSISSLKEVTDGEKKHVVVSFLDETSSLEIDCNLRMFMKLIGKEYKSWSECMIEQSVKNGTLMN